MKKLNILVNILICASLSLWAIQALLSYHNYTRHVALFAANGWHWYDHVLPWGKYVIPIAAVCFLVKFLICRKTKE